MTKRTTRAIAAFKHDSYTGSRSNLAVDAGTEVRKVGVDMNDPLDGEPVVWFEAKIDGDWTKLGAIRLPVLTRGWKAELFADAAAVRDEADD